jgi:hypothetical protein
MHLLNSHNNKKYTRGPVLKLHFKTIFFGNSPTTVRIPTLHARTFPYRMCKPCAFVDNLFLTIWRGCHFSGKVPLKPM